MTIILDHTIVPARDKSAAARFFAGIFGLEVGAPTGPFVPVRVNASLTLDFHDRDPSGMECHHLAFRVSEDEFDRIVARVQAAGVAYGSEPFSPEDGRINRRHGGRGVYFRDPNGHLLELLTSPPVP